MDFKKLLGLVGLSMAFGACQDDLVQPKKKVVKDETATVSRMNFTTNGLEIEAHSDTANSASGRETDITMKLQQRQRLGLDNTPNFNAGVLFEKFELTADGDSAEVKFFLMRHGAYTALALTDTNGLDDGEKNDVALGNTAFTGKAAISGDPSVVKKAEGWNHQRSVNLFEGFDDKAEGPGDVNCRLLTYRVNIADAFQRTSLRQDGKRIKEKVRMVGE